MLGSRTVKDSSNDTRSLLSLPVNRSKNFNYLLKGAKITHFFVNSNDDDNKKTNIQTSVNNNNNSYMNNRQFPGRPCQIPSVHNMNRYKSKGTKINSNSSPIFKSEFLFSDTHLKSMISISSSMATR